MRGTLNKQCQCHYSGGNGRQRQCKSGLISDSQWQLVLFYIQQNQLGVLSQRLSQNDKNKHMYMYT